MAQERLAPDAILTNTGFVGTVSAIQDDPDSPDGSWLTSDGTDSQILRLSFPTPSPNLDQGTGLQEFRVLVRKSATGGGDPTMDIHLYENGTDISQSINATTVTSTTGQVYAVTWDAAQLSNVSGSNVEIYIEGFKGGGGPNERNLHVGAVEWNASYTTYVAPLEITPEPATAAAKSESPITVLGSLVFTPPPIFVSERQAFTNMGGEEGNEPGPLWAYSWQSGSHWISTIGTSGIYSRPDGTAPEGSNVLETYPYDLKCIASEERIPVDPTRMTLSESVYWKRATGDAPTVYLYRLEYDSDGALIRDKAVYVDDLGTETTLAADLTAGTKTITLTDGTGWVSSTDYGIQFYIENDQSDLPNHDWQHISTVVGNTVTLVNNSPRTYPAGTKVRQSREYNVGYGSTLYRTFSPTDSWVKYEPTAKPSASVIYEPGGTYNNYRWRPGTAYVGFAAVLYEVGTNHSHSFDDINFTLEYLQEEKAVARATGVDPTVSIVLQPIVPLPASAVATAVDPTVAAIGTTVKPAPATAVSTGVDPNTVQGSISITPTPASATTTGVDPEVPEPPLLVTTTPSTAATTTLVSSVVLGSVSIRAPPVSTVGAAIDPAVVQSSVSITPDPSTVVGTSVNPNTVLGSISVSTTPASATTTAVDPTVDVGALIVTSSPASAVATTVAPTVVQSSVSITPEVVTAAASGVDPTTVLGSLTIIPGPRGGGSGDPVVSQSLFTNWGGEDGVDGSGYALNWQSGSLYDVLDGTNQGFDAVTTQSVVGAPEGSYVLQAAPAGYAFVVSEERIPVSPTDTPLSMSVSLKRVSGTGTAYFCYLNYDANGTLIRNYAVWVESLDTETTLASDLNINDTTAELTDGTGWNTFAARAIQFNIENDQSDLPNHDYQEQSSFSGTTVTLAAPSPKFYPAGTKVRQVRGGYNAHDIVGSGQPADFTTYSTDIQANDYMSVPGAPSAGTWRPGTAYVTPCIIYTAAGTVQWDNVDFTQYIPATETEGAAYSSATAVDPFVLIGDINVRPTPASAAGTGVDPTVVQTSITFTPGAVSAVASGVDPNVSIGALVVKPTAATATTTAVNPTTVQSSVSITTTPASAIAVGLNPNTVQSTLTIGPAAVSAVVSTVNPNVSLGSITISPTAGAAVATAVDPAIIQSSITISPSPLTAVATAVDPIITGGGGVVFTPTAASVVGAGIEPTVILTTITITPPVVSATATGVDPNVSLGAEVVSPQPATAIADGVDPSVVIGTIQFTPNAAAAIGTGVDPFVIQTSIVYSPSPAEAATSTVFAGLILFTPAYTGRIDSLIHIPGIETNIVQVLSKTKCIVSIDVPSIETVKLNSPREGTVVIDDKETSFVHIRDE